MGEYEHADSIVRPHTVAVPISARRKSTLRFLRILTLLLTLALLGSAGAAYYFYAHERDAATPLEESSALVRAVGEHILLPLGIEPKIGKITNPDQFKSDPFLAQVQLGDIVLFYPHQEKTVKAIIWRPSLGKIVDVSLVTLPQPLKS